jgi:tRNA-2-methylthio-N6-dimethylallyladenosine synthase
VKKRRLTEIIDLQNAIAREKNKAREGQVVRVLAEGRSKRSEDDLMGRCDENIVVIFPKEDHEPGNYVDVLIERSTTTSLIGKAVAKVPELNLETVS